MNLVGKIFVFLIFLMSMVFMSTSVFVYATHKNWRAEIERTEPGGPHNVVGWKKQLEVANEKYKQLTSKLQALEEEYAAERAARRQQIAKLEAERERLLAEAATVNTKYTAIVKLKDDAVQALAVAQDNLTKLSAEVDLLRGEIVAARKTINDRFDEVVKLTERIHAAEGQIRILTQRREQLVQDLAKAEAVLKAHDLSKDTPTSEIAPKVDGFILAVNNQRGFVEISIGSDDGLLKGHEMEVYRGGKYLGRIEIVRTTPDRAVAKINEDYKQAPFQKGDRVETRRSLKLVAGEV